MQEEFKKNFVLLSKVAKEKKYAQEYLGLLARRGDIGSIRIGKRWYTTVEWFSEFLSDAAMKKTEFAPRDFPDKMELKQAVAPERENLQIANGKIRHDFGKKENQEIFFALREKETAPEDAVGSKIEIKKTKTALAAPGAMRPLPAKIKFETVDLRKKNEETAGALQDIARKKFNAAMNGPRKNDAGKLAQKEKTFQAQRFQPRGMSPNFAGEAPRFSFFSKLAFSTAAVLLMVLFFQFGFVYKKEIAGLAGFRQGVVAGVSDEKTNFSGVKKNSAEYLDGKAEKMKEKISLSRVLIRAAMEREGN